ncbi:hypothetical protein [Variovorax defluvii]
MTNAYASISVYRGWVVSLTLDSTPGQGLEGCALMQFEGVCMERLAYASASQSFDEALTVLGQEAEAFVDRWHVMAAARQEEQQAELVEA